MEAIITCSAPVNIAVVKYWGKRDEDLILPINDSISVTLDGDQMHAKTTVAISPDLAEDRMWLNGKEEAVADNKRLVSCLNQVRSRSAGAGPHEGKGNERSGWKVHICSNNNFPTAAGLASSAAGYACLVYALSRIYGIEGDISELARRGSGSACRSVHGGFVRWNMGRESDGSDSVAASLKEATHWPDLKCLVLVVEDGKKKVPSSLGMKRSVETSAFLEHRSRSVVPATVDRMVEAIERRDFDEFATLTMKDSNSMHAACLDTFPPCVYMNDVSHSIADLVHQVNAVYGPENGGNVLCYTFDAGPNACLFLLEKHLSMVLGLVGHYFGEGSVSGNVFFRGMSVSPKTPDEETLGRIHVKAPRTRGSVKYVISTGVGDGPKVMLSDTEHLLDSRTGLPKGMQS